MVKINNSIMKNELAENFTIVKLLKKTKKLACTLYGKHEFIEIHYSLNNLIAFSYANNIVVSSEAEQKNKYPLIFTLDSFINIVYDDETLDFENTKINTKTSYINSKYTVDFFKYGSFLPNEGEKLLIITPSIGISKEKVIHDLKEYIKKLNETILFYNELANLLSDHNFKKEYVIEFLKKYKEDKDLITLILVCSPEERKEYFLNEMKNNEISCEIKDVQNLIGKIKKSLKTNSDTFVINKLSESIKKIEEDIKNNKNGFPLLKSAMLKNKLEEHLQKGQQVTKLRVKI